MDYNKEIFGSENVVETVLNINSEDDYLFTNCTFVNVKINASVSYMEFDNCKFLGNVTIYNQGIGSIDTVRILDMKNDGATENKLNIVSASVWVHLARFSSECEVTLTGGEVEVLDSDFNGKTNIECYLSLVVKDSNIKSLHVDRPNDDSVTVENSVVNGIEIKSASANFDDLIKNK